MQHHALDGATGRRALLGSALFAGGALVATAGVSLVALTGPAVWAGGISLPRVALALVGLLVPGSVLALHRALGPSTTAWRGSVVAISGALVGLAVYAAAPLSGGLQTSLALVGLGGFVVATFGLVAVMLRTALQRPRALSPSGDTRQTAWSRTTSQSGPNGHGGHPADGGEESEDLVFPLDDEGTTDRDR